MGMASATPNLFQITQEVIVADAVVGNKGVDNVALIPPLLVLVRRTSKQEVVVGPVRE